ncbi:hypothetical protein [Maricaulis sp. CAU 1757]
MSEVHNRFSQTVDALRESLPRQDRSHAPFAALAGINSALAPQAFARETLKRLGGLNDRLGHWRAPERAMRPIYAAVLAAADCSVAEFFRVRTALSERRKARGARGLAQGGSPAALALVAAGGKPDMADDFFDIRETISAPWWRRDANSEAVLAACLTALGETPVTAREKLERTERDLVNAGIPKGVATKAMHEVMLLPYRPDRLSGNWTTINLAVRKHGSLRSNIGREGLAVLAASGPGHAMAEALLSGHAHVRSLKPRSCGGAAGRIAMRLAQAEAGQLPVTSAAGDLAAILAAQAAMMAAMVASTSTAVAVTSS